MSIFRKSDEATEAASELTVVPIIDEGSAGAPVNGEASLDDAGFRAEIAILDKRIEKKAQHIKKLEGELEDMKLEQRGLKQNRLALLQRELEP